MKSTAIFATTDGRRHDQELSSVSVDFLKPTGGVQAAHELSGFCFIRLAVRAKLWPQRSLDQVNAPIGAGTMILFEGLFLFVFPCLKCWDTFCSLFFFFK